MTVVSAPRRAAEWTEVCRAEAMTPDRGVAVLLDGRQIAVFLLRDGSVHALDNHDPASRANVLSRGIVGDRGGEPVVASPVYKQCFDLATGQCLDDPQHAVQVHEARVVDGALLVRLRS
jgi:nitrite reductase (NADH) small subunit